MKNSIHHPKLPALRRHRGFALVVTLSLIMKTTSIVGAVLLANSLSGMAMAAESRKPNVIIVFTTIAALSRATLPAAKIDGKSILPLLEGRAAARSPHEAYFYRTQGVRVGDWKLIDGKLFKRLHECMAKPTLKTGIHATR